MGHGEGIVQTTNAQFGRRRKPKWYENLLSERKCGFDSRRPHQAPTCHMIFADCFAKAPCLAHWIPDSPGSSPGQALSLRFAPFQAFGKGAEVQAPEPAPVSRMGGASEARATQSGTQQHDIHSSQLFRSVENGPIRGAQPPNQSSGRRFAARASGVRSRRCQRMTGRKSWTSCARGEAAEPVAAVVAAICRDGAG
jgi:hypothetical protein